MVPHAVIAHELPGRLRLRIPARRGDGAFFAELAEALRLAPDSPRTEMNWRTGSVLILHAGTKDAVVEFARERGLFDLVGVVAPAPSRQRHLRHKRQRLSPMRVAAAAFAVLSLYQTVRSRGLGNATESLWHAYQARFVQHRPWTSAALVALGIYQLGVGRVLGSASSLAMYALGSAHHAGLAEQAAEALEEE